LERPYAPLWLLAFALGLGGCAHYSPMPLPAQAASARTDIGSAPLSTVEIERQVLMHDPELQTARARHQIAQAQLLQAGILPNPSFDANVGYLLSGPGDATAWTLGLNEDMQALLTLRTRRSEAKAAANQVDAELLWQEWQTLGKARLLAVDIVEDEALAIVQHRLLESLDTRRDALQQALERHAIDQLSAAPDIAAAADAHAAWDELQRRLLDERQALNAMLDLAPNVHVTLSALPESPPLDSRAVTAAADRLAQHRPDLLALAAGYAAQDARLRSALLAQFPPLSFGFAAAQDNSRVRSGGPAVTFALPIFDRNQGAIAVERATRQQLYDEYVARLRQSRDEVLGLLAEHEQLGAQRQALASLALADRQRQQEADIAWRRGSIDLRTYVDLIMATATREMNRIALEKAAREQRVAIDILLGTGLPGALPTQVTAP